MSRLIISYRIERCFKRCVLGDGGGVSARQYAELRCASSSNNSLWIYFPLCIIISNSLLREEGCEVVVGLNK